MTEGFYVSVVNGRRVGLLAGPFDTEPDARAFVEAAQAESERIDPFAHFYAFGTVKAPTRKPGTLNARLGIGALRDA
jgi:hypothetical protein